MNEKTGKAIPPKERIKNFNEFHIPLSEAGTEITGRTLHGLRRSLLPVRHDDHAAWPAAVRYTT